MTAPGFIDRHGLWTDEQRRHAEALRQRIEKEALPLIRLTWADPHGCSRAKAVTAPVFLEALAGSGYNINVATTTLDSAGARTFSSFTRGGGMGLDEMTGSPNITLVPDPATFRVLPWAGVGWVLCDEYFNSGVPFHFSPRHLLRKQMQRLRGRGMGYRVGLEVEWYLFRVAEDHLTEEHVGAPGIRGRPVRTHPIEPGHSYHSESNLDLMQPVLAALVDAFAKLELPLRSIENEFGPGQVECTFSAQIAADAADALVLFRTATRQICRRMGYFATFMCRPAFKGYCSSGWHLHQSLVDARSGENLFAPKRAGERLAPLGQAFLGGLLKNAPAATAFATPTVNGYRRFKPNSLAPDRAGWGYDHRGAMIRVLGGMGDPGTRMENRVGEPAANPYLYMLSQLVSGVDGIDNTMDPGPEDDAPYQAERALLPRSLMEALDALEQSALFRREVGDVFVDYFVKLKRSEAGRFLRFLDENGLKQASDEPTEWEQNEYFDVF